MFQVTTHGEVSRVREPSPYGMKYDLLLAEFEADSTTMVEVWFLLASTKLRKEAAREILAERGVYV